MTTSLQSAVSAENFSGSVQAPKSIPLIPTWLNDYGLTATEFRVYCHIVTKAGLSGKCSESVPAIAQSCRLSRNVTLRALQNLSEIHQLLLRNKRPGETDEYSIAPESQWQPPVPDQDRVLTRQKIETKETDSSIRGMGCDESEPILYEDTNIVSDQDDFEESIEYKQEWSDESGDVEGIKDTTPASSIWRRNPDATRYCQIPPIYNQATGVEIQNQIETEGLTAQAVVSRAIAFSKVPKLILETLFAIAELLVSGHKWLMQVLPRQTRNQEDGCDLIPDFS